MGDTILRVDDMRFWCNINPMQIPMKFCKR